MVSTKQLQYTEIKRVDPHSRQTGKAANDALPVAMQNGF